MSDYKKCSTCHKTKHLNKFWKDKHNPSGYRAECILCHFHKQNNYRKNRQESTGIVNEYKRYRKESMSTKRLCLGVKCRGLKIFKSSWPGERICPECAIASERFYEQ